MFLCVGSFVFASGIGFSGKETASSLEIDGLPYKLDCGPPESLLPIAVSPGPSTVTWPTEDA